MFRRASVNLRPQEKRWRADVPFRKALKKTGSRTKGNKRILKVVHAPPGTVKRKPNNLHEDEKISRS